MFVALGLIVGGGFKERLGSDSFQKHSVQENLLWTAGVDLKRGIKAFSFTSRPVQVCPEERLVCK